MRELQYVIWKLAGDDGTFGEFIQRSEYKDSLLDKFFTVCDRLCTAWRTIKLTGEGVIPDGARPRDLRRSERRKKFPFLMEGQSSDVAKVQDDDEDATVAHSNFLSDKCQNSWEN